MGCVALALRGPDRKENLEDYREMEFDDFRAVYEFAVRVGKPARMRRSG
jgi:hypothetical protein